MVISVEMIITRWGGDYAVSLASPQLPGIVAAFDEDPSPAQVRETAIEAGLDPDGEVTVHIEDSFDLDGTQYFVRARHDFYSTERTRVKTLAIKGLHDNPEMRDYGDEDRFGDVTVVVALPSDSVDSTLATAETNQPIMIVVEGEPNVLRCAGIVCGDGSHEGPSLSDWGLDGKSTVGELLEQVEEHALHESRRLVHA